MKVKILVSYHKPAKIIKDDVWTPIKIGSCCNWDTVNLIEDNVGDNISSLNTSYNELTAIYWAWKNYDKLGDPDFIGFCHYRRVPIFSQTAKRKSDSFTVDVHFDDLESLFKEINYSSETIERLLNDNHCLAGSFIDKHSVKEQYKKVSSSGEHIYQDLLDVENIVEEIFPKYKRASQIYLNGKKQYFGNIFILRKDLFFEYCEFIFKVIDLFVSRHKLAERSQWLQRLFVSERVTGIFIAYLRQQGFKVLDLPVGFIVNTELPSPVEKFYKTKDSINLVFFVDNYGLSRLGVCLTSLMERVKNNRLYDIVVLFSEMKAEQVEHFLAKIDLIRPESVSVRFYDINPWLEKLQLRKEKVFSFAYSRFLTQEIFLNYEKVLCLGSDLIVCGDISQIYDLQRNESEYIAASLSVRGSFSYQQNVEVKKGIGWKDYVNEKLGIKNDCVYFQTGVMLAYLEEMRKDNFNLYDVCVRELKKIEEPVYFEQDVLNAALSGHVKYFSVGWNLEWEIPIDFPSYKRVMSEDLLREYTKGRKNPNIINYCSSKKPWNEGDSPFASVWWKYARSSLFYQDFVKNTLYGFSAKDAKDVIGVLLRKALRYWKYRVFSVLGIKKTHYVSKLRE